MLVSISIDSCIFSPSRQSAVWGRLVDRLDQSVGDYSKSAQDQTWRALSLKNRSHHLLSEVVVMRAAMCRQWKLWTFAGIGLLALVVTCVVSQLGAQVPENGNGNGNKVVPGPLPIKQVVLFNSGVGYFQREGDVDGNAKVDLTFPVSDINDLLKSLVLQDLGGGRVSTVSYDSHEPIDRILRSFALDLNNNPTFSQLLNQARGEKIEILHREKKDAQPVKLTG